jgi:hypothetical protein
MAKSINLQVNLKVSLKLGSKYKLTLALYGVMATSVTKFGAQKLPKTFKIVKTY